MKKEFIYAALASVMLLCSACGKQGGAPDEEAVTEENQTGTDTAAEAPGESGIQATENTEPSSHISIRLQTEEDSDTARDGTVLYTSVVIYPIVSIEGNEAAADKINADILTRVDSFRADTTVRDFAGEIYQSGSVAGNSGNDFISYNNDLDFTVARSDSNVISFVITYYSYAGGAHGNYGSTGVNYSAQTGELIDFADLGENADTFYADTLAFNQALAATDSYKELLFEDAALSGDLETVLYAGDKWYLSTSGLIFISDPYALGPYSSGLIEFVIPYSDLDDMGLKEEYQYAGNLTVKLPNGESDSIDINGDGQNDTILFHTAYEGDQDGLLEFVAHLIINGIDVSQGYNEELSQVLTAYPWSECVLYDMDASDDTIEIVLVSTEHNEESGGENITFSSFFRYEKDGSITYLDRTRGAVTDPTAVS